MAVRVEEVEEYALPVPRAGFAVLNQLAPFAGCRFLLRSYSFLQAQKKRIRLFVLFSRMPVGVLEHCNSRCPMCVFLYCVCLSVCLIVCLIVCCVRVLSLVVRLFRIVQIKSGDYTIYVHIIEARDLKAEDLQAMIMLKCWIADRLLLYFCTVLSANS